MGAAADQLLKAAKESKMFKRINTDRPLPRLDDDERKAQERARKTAHPGLVRG